MRVDLLVDKSGDIVLGEFTPTPFSGKLHCFAEGNSAESLDPCVLGRLWSELPSPDAQPVPQFLADWRDLTYPEKCARALAAADGSYDVVDNPDDIMLGLTHGQEGHN